jgi:hypothetical protein
MEWLAGCDFLNERFDSIGEAWADAVEYTREISPRMDSQQLRALRMVFYAAAFGALKAAPKSCSYEQFEATMAAGWTVFVPACVLPCIRPRTLPVFSPEAVQSENGRDRRTSARLLARRRSSDASVSTRRLRFSRA